MQKEVVLQRRFGDVRIHEDNKSPTLESGMGCGGLNVPIVLAAFEGNGTRPSHKGSGFNDGEKMFTLNGTEVHGVVCKN